MEIINIMAIIESKRMRKILVDGDYTLWEYTPSLIKPLYDDIDPLSLIRRIRLMIEKIQGGYKVFYLEVNGVLVGYNVFAPGGRRLKCSTKQDLVDGPSFVASEQRGKGYVTTLKKRVLNNCCCDYNYVYGWIAKNNIPSIKACIKAGFDVEYGELRIEGLMRNLKQVPKGEGTNVIIRYRIPK